MSMVASIEGFRLNGSIIVTDAGQLIEQAHAIVAAIANQEMPDVSTAERLCQPFILSLAHAAETLLHLAAFSLEDERRETCKIDAAARRINK